MDLNLYLGPPRSAPRPPRLDLGSDLVLGSPAGPSPFSVSSSPASSTEEFRAPGPAAAGADMASPPSPHAPYSPSCASFADPTDHLPPLSAAGDDGAREYSPYSPSYQPLGPPYAPITPPPPTPAVPPRGHDALYPASYVRVFPVDQDSGEGLLEGGSRAALHRPYDPLSPTALVEESWVGGGAAGRALPHAPYSPPYVPLSMIPEEQEEVAYPQRRVFLGSPDAYVRDDGSSSRPGFRDPGFRLRRYIALQHRPWEGRPFRMSNYYADEQRTSGAMNASDQLAHETLNSEASPGFSRKSKAGAEGDTDEGSEEGKEERNASAVNFECNICLELAKEPVVTPCGHLFCWPCLYQWLHLHCSYNECPVCKGEVTEPDITPIYGRGSTQSRLEKEDEDENSGLKIPPRPHGRRSEGWRQRIQRPISRRFGLEIANSWRHLFGEEIHTGSLIEADGDPSLQRVMGVEGTLMARRSTRLGENVENGFFSVGRLLPSSGSSSNPPNDSSTHPILRGSFEEIWARISANSLDRGGGSAATAVGPSRLLARTDGSANLTGASPLLDTQNPGGSIPVRPPVGSSQAVGQASASSTMAMIQEDAGIADATAEPNSAGSSRHPRIRGRGTSSLYVDGCSIHPCKRRHN